MSMLGNDDNSEPEYEQEVEESNVYEKSREPRGVVWEHFQRLSRGRGSARCNYCSRVLSFKTSITNLKKHLCVKHPEYVSHSELATKDYLYVNTSKKSGSHTTKKRRKRSWRFSDGGDDTSPTTTRASEIPTGKFSSEIWRNFEQEDDGAKCILCQEYLPSNLDEIKNHLEEHHTSVLDEIIAKAQKSQDPDSDDDILADDIYTEVLYLEDESGNKLNYSPKKVKLNRSSRQEPLENRVKNEAKHEPTTSKEPNQDGLEIFLSYVRVLLKRIPKADSQKLHYDIINLIMNTEFKSQTRNNVAETVTSNNVCNNVTLLDKHNVILFPNGPSSNNVADSSINSSQRVATAPLQQSVPQNDETVERNTE